MKAEITPPMACDHPGVRLAASLTAFCTGGVLHGFDESAWNFDQVGLNARVSDPRVTEYVLPYGSVHA